MEVVSAMGRADIQSEENAFPFVLTRLLREAGTIREHGSCVLTRESQVHEAKTGRPRPLDCPPERSMHDPRDGALEGLGGVFCRVRIVVLWIPGKGWRGTIK